jgi:hypothetical protein
LPPSICSARPVLVLHEACARVIGSQSAPPLLCLCFLTCRRRRAPIRSCLRSVLPCSVDGFVLLLRRAAGPVSSALGFASTPPCAVFGSVEARTAAAGPVSVLCERARACPSSPAAHHSRQFRCLPKRRRRGKPTILPSVLSCVFACRRAGPVLFVSVLGFRAATPRACFSTAPPSFPIGFSKSRRRVFPRNRAAAGPVLGLRCFWPVPISPELPPFPDLLLPKFSPEATELPCAMFLPLSSSVLEHRKR